MEDDELPFGGSCQTLGQTTPKELYAHSLTPTLTELSKMARYEEFAIAFSRIRSHPVTRLLYVQISHTNDDKGKDSSCGPTW